MSGTDNLAASIVKTLSHAAPSLRYTFRSRDFGTDELDAAAMRRRIGGFAAALRRAKIPPRAVTPIVAGSSAALWAAFVGAMGADLIPCILPVPTFKTHMPSTCKSDALMQRYGSTFVVAGGAYGAMIAPIAESAGSRLDLLPLEEIDRPSDDWTPPRAAARDVAFLQHSSGSTGVPRGVALSHAAVLGHLAVYGRSIDFDPRSDRIASWLPLYHDMGLLTSFLLPLVGGASCDTIPPAEWIMDPLSILALMTERRSTLTWWPNFTFALLSQRVRPAELVSYDLRGARLLINCGEPVLRSSREAFA